MRIFTILLLILFLSFPGCSYSPCIRMEEPNPIGVSIRLCKDGVQMRSIHSDSWYICNPPACFSSKDWASIDLWKISMLPNFHKVSDNLYRGAQQNREGFILLQSMGIKTIVNLRSFHTDWWYIHGLGFNCVSIPVKAWHPEMEDAKKFLSVVKNKDNWPVFVHCQHGSDRTGTMVAIYRIVVQGWTVEKATKEMVEGPFGFHEIWEGILPPFLKQFEK